MLIIIFVILFAGFSFEAILDYLNIKNWSSDVPSVMKDVFSDDKYKKARDYSMVNYRFSTLSSFFSLGILTFALANGLFGKLDEYIRSFSSSTTVIALLFFGVIGIVSDFLSLPFSLYKTFIIEEKFGFNKTTVRTFILDKLKGFLLTIILGGLILSALVKVFELTGTNFWWMAWILLTVFMLLATIFYASWILPIFNKLTPLPEGELRQAIETYCRKNNFPLNDIFVMDGSKRSSKANAFFSGLGKKKKIVLFDTLINNHSIEELVAVLAHETGHFKLKHTLTGFIAGIFQTGIMLFVFSLIQGNPALIDALQANVAGLHLELLAFGFLYTPISAISGILMHLISRKNEFEADAFAKKTYDGISLVTALKKLSADSLSNLTPHPAYVFVHYSHPPLLERIRVLST